ncbi:hypothetical protein CHLRE_17g704650v5 [Chlamydomonas reinhardtii]|uniref:Uncharacterized protein n=1 Tax=Chlamydomonas reinhardtii TaxID=3055 RepID=A0A2K3CP60_CHLRE|nr:uncharacterized protein CHLRE_17g704650v5 [Chlamydomonas reinhardtii]PNW70074.1 hypothetical protein CHLRE_17g704650v5 [Chlamydomonas reinhardtii]
MPRIEDEIYKLNSEIDKFLAEEGDGDSGDEGSSAEAVTLRPKPGAITPLGVRVDRGAGFLGANGATATIGEMDSTLANIRAWKQKHEREMLEMRQRNEQRNEALAQAAGSGDAKLGAQPGAPAPDVPGDALQAAAQGAITTALGDEADADLRELTRERRERQERLVSGIRQKYSAAEDGSGLGRGGVDGGGIGAGSDGPAAQALLAASGVRASRPSVSHPPLESLLRDLNVWSSVDPATSAAVGARVTYMPPGTSAGLDRPISAARKKAEVAANAAVLRGQQLMAELEAELRALEGPGGAGGGGGADAGSTAARPGDTLGDVASFTGMRASSFARPGSGSGPLGAVDMNGRSAAGVSEAGGLGFSGSGGGVGGAAADAGLPLDPLLDWSVQLQGVLARMDALQTGYQAGALAAACGADTSSRPGSGRAGGSGAGSAAGLRTASASSLMPPRPGSARIKLDPLPQAPALLAAAAAAAASGSARGQPGAAVKRSGSSGSTSMAGGGTQQEDPGPGAGSESVHFAGSRIRQLREMQRQDSAQ